MKTTNVHKNTGLPKPAQKNLGWPWWPKHINLGPCQFHSSEWTWNIRFNATNQQFWSSTGKAGPKWVQTRWVRKSTNFSCVFTIITRVTTAVGRQCRKRGPARSAMEGATKQDDICDFPLLLQLCEQVSEQAHSNNHWQVVVSQSSRGWSKILRCVKFSSDKISNNNIYPCFLERTSTHKTKSISWSYLKKETGRGIESWVWHKLTVQYSLGGWQPWLAGTIVPEMACWGRDAHRGRGCQFFCPTWKQEAESPGSKNILSMQVRKKI